MPRFQITRIFFALCFFAVLGAQLFGVTRAFLCDCSGTKEVVKVNSCTGPHGEKCHKDESQQRSDTPDDGEKGDRKEHEQVKEDFTGTTVNVPNCAIPFPVFLAVLPELLLSIPASLDVPLDYFTESYSAPPSGIAVARTVVLLL